MIPDTRNRISQSVFAVFYGLKRLEHSGVLSSIIASSLAVNIDLI